MSDSHYDVLIIGAGMSGLAAGIRLAMYDHRVCILERHTTIGGLNSFYRLKGRNFDVGLHAVTNFTPKGTRQGPLARVLKQLRFSWDDLQLVPQLRSQVAFGSRTLDFSNDPELLIAEVAREFPAEADAFRRLVTELPSYDALGTIPDGASGREFLAAYIRDPLLAEMILAPLFYYGSAREDDVDADQFVILFRSIYLEGFCRPREGVRLLLRLLTRRYKQLGGELRLRAGVESIRAAGNRVTEVVLENGETLTARRIVSSAGWPETRQLLAAGQDTAAPETANLDDRPAGQLSFIESLSVLDRPYRELGGDKTIIFFNDGEKIAWHKPAELVDLRSGVVCVPENFAFTEPFAMSMVRVTCLANFDRWAELPREEYLAAKESWYPRVQQAIAPYCPDFSDHVVDHDFFTPTTIRRFTSHDNGAVYGAPDKQRDGRTPLENLFICGTDQGFVGIIGTLVSGIAIANLYLLGD